jgi:hypothetical protein
MDDSGAAALARHCLTGRLRRFGLHATRNALTAAGVKSLYTLRAELWSAGARAAVRVQPPRSGLNVAADTVDDPASHPHYCHDPFFVTPDRWIVHGAPRPLPRRVGPCDPWDRQPHTSPPCSFAGSTVNGRELRR